jgi:apolipoprotein D and lipocalin family protein
VKTWVLMSAAGLALLGAGVGLSTLLSAGDDSRPPLRVVPKVDLTRYTGTWYEIARYPNRFQKDCVATTATYTLRPDGRVTVVNRCRQKTLDGKVKEAEGVAWVVDKGTNAKLKVRFFWPFSGDYWIIDLGPDYEYAVVGHPKRSYLWILSRTPSLDPAVYQGILDRIAAQGYDLKPLIQTPQSVP